ncbi:43841_t:CDS:2, partial [Gigaspora margarita]
TRQLLATIKQAVLGKNHLVISLDLQPETQINISASHMKFESFSLSNVNTNRYMNNKLEESGSEGSEGSEMDISSNSNSDSSQNKGGEAIDISDINRFFERFLLVNFIISVIIPATNKYACKCERGWNDLTWMEFMRFIGILTIMTYIKFANVNDYWSNKQETAG